MAGAAGRPGIMVCQVFIKVSCGKGNLSASGSGMAANKHSL